MVLSLRKGKYMKKQIKNLLLFYWQRAGGSEYCLIQILSGRGVRIKSWTFRAPKGAGNVFKRTTRKSLGIV